MSLHATLEKSNAGTIVGFLLKLELAAVLHELAELIWVAAAQFFQTGLYLLFLDVVVLFVFGAARETLPWQLSLYQV